ncbi:hypothetical protein CEQ50_16430 [Vibrio anguillarum]|uniref:hypothetical protein n=1 Tax=Vibrio anguillarum TaxID=55601 RepID=UPI000B548E50|nr:hypothetical protein [Vibrio anguillarum]ASG09126.1 hypothetical protein CEQ50_16430 [Vibrio anguillarum]
MSDVIDYEKYKEESDKLKNYLNSVVGLATFSLALACLSFENSRVIALFCTPLVFGLAFAAPAMRSLLEALNLIESAESKLDRELMKENLYEITNRESKLKFILSLSVYIYSLVFFMLVLFTPWFARLAKGLML